MSNGKTAPHSGSFFPILAEEAMMGFLTFNSATRKCTYANKLAREMIELSTRTNLNDLKLDQLFPAPRPSPHFRAFNEELLLHEGVYQDVYIQKANHLSFIANVGIKKILYGEDYLLLLMLQDVTQQKKLQREIAAKQGELESAYQELLTQNKQLKELDLAKNRFIALTTHELRTPLSAMIASSEILKLGLYDDDEQLNEFVTMIYEQGIHLSELVNDILDFAKIQAGKMDYYLSELSVVALIENQVEALEQFAESNEVRLHFQKPEEPCLCYYDSVRMKQVINNIVNNAIKYNKPGGSVRVWVESTPDHHKIFVKDTGKGMNAEEMGKIFDEFETLGKVALHHQGTGLGMPITKRLIEGMGGQIQLESEPGVGSTFWVEIPRHKILDESLYRERPDQDGDLAA